jgi:hypothetical protein
MGSNDQVQGKNPSEQCSYGSCFSPFHLAKNDVTTDVTTAPKNAYY